MTTFNQLGDFGLNQVLARRLTTPGPAPSPTLEPAIFPGVTLENDRPEWGHFKGEYRFGAQGAVGAVAGQRAKFRVVNAVGTGVICVIDSWAALAAGASLTFRRCATLPPNLGTLIGTTPYDTRRNMTTFSSRLTVSTGNEVGSTPSAQAFETVTAATVLTLNGPLVLTPGQAFEVEALADNQAISWVNLAWYERTAQPGEL